MTWRRSDLRMYMIVYIRMYMNVYECAMDGCVYGKDLVMRQCVVMYEEYQKTALVTW